MKGVASLTAARRTPGDGFGDHGFLQSRRTGRRTGEISAVNQEQWGSRRRQDLLRQEEEEEENFYRGTSDVHAARGGSAIDSPKVVSQDLQMMRCFFPHLGKKTRERISSPPMGSGLSIHRRRAIQPTRADSIAHSRFDGAGDYPDFCFSFLERRLIGSFWSTCTWR